MRSLSLRFSVGLFLVVGAGLAIGKERVILNDPEFPFFHATAMDQPRLYGVLTDGGEVITDENGAVLFRAFIDTGSSGFVLSNLHATGDHDTASFGFGEEDYIGSYTNVGIGGEELGSVSRPFGIRLLNAPLPADGNLSINDFVPYGEHSLWVRNAPGTGEVVVIPVGGFYDYQMVSPVNIVGMPVIEQRVMVMEWVDIPPELVGLLPETAKELETKLLLSGDPEIPPYNATLDLGMRDFVGEAPPGEVLPSMGRNPVVKNVTISHDPEKPSLTADWLFDTGAGSSFISFNWAKQIGLIPEHYETLEEFVVDHEADGGLISEVGGIGEGSVKVPLLELSEIEIPAKEGFDVVWQNARVHILDHPELADLGLEGIFGMNLIGPAATVDSALFGGGLEIDNELLFILLLAMLSDMTPSPFSTIAFEVTGEETAELRLFHDSLDLPPSGPTTFQEWRESRFAGEELNNPSISGPNADPDGDGIPNLLEYALGIPPRSALPVVSVTEENGEFYLTLTYGRRTSAEDVEIRIEESHDLKTWTPAQTNPVEIIENHGRENVTVRDVQSLGGGERKFLRLHVELLPDS